MSISRLLLTGTILIGSMAVLTATQARYGSVLFFGLVAALTVSYVLVLTALRNPPAGRRLLMIAFALAAASRFVPSAGRINFDSDMIRYVWDGRVQRFGYNPYAVIPSDPALAHTHTPDTARMPSRNVATPYPPAAQLFFRTLVTVSESPRVMRLALVACDLLTIFFVWRWLAATGRNEWLALAYAWNPLVVLEVAHGGHIDALGAFWIAASAYWLSRRRTALASVAFTLAVATKLLPVVLAPLFFRRVRVRDIALAAVVMLGLYAPFASSATLPVGAVPNVVQHIRFNSPVFRPLAWVITPHGAAVFALAAAVGVAIWARISLDRDDPAAWAWPMAVALACAPVVYPWYLLYITPFLLSRATLPLTVWTLSILPVYIVWERALGGAPWRVPNAVMVAEYGLVLAMLGAVLLGARQAADPRALPAPATQD